MQKLKKLYQVVYLVSYSNKDKNLLKDLTIQKRRHPKVSYTSKKGI